MSRKLIGFIVEWIILVPSRFVTCSLNFLTGGSFYEPFCSRVWRKWAHGHSPKFLWTALHRGLDVALRHDPEHCWNQFIKTKQRKVHHWWDLTWLWRTF